MPRLIIGHTTHNSATIWIRGDHRYSHGFVTVEGPGKKQTKHVLLEQRHGFTSVAIFKGLKPRTQYTCKVGFGDSHTASEPERVDYGHCTGKFKTFPKLESMVGPKFLLGSCNLHSLGPLQSPDKVFKRLGAIAETEKTDFMIHCGDQIYYDVPRTPQPSAESYRAKYLDAWGDSRPTRKFLTTRPHYMILDDHELVNNFSNDMQSPIRDTPLEVFKTFALKTYREFQHIHSPGNHGNSALHYDFSFGSHRFYMLDARSERIKSGDGKQMISDDQLKNFLSWLSKHKDEVKFVTSSVPFVTEDKSSTDKWNYYRVQRERILDHILRKKITGVVFLTGDQHSSYHATLDVSDGVSSVTVHELMSSPLNQVFKTGFSQYESRHRTNAQNKKFYYTSKLIKSEFYNDHSNAMIVKANGREVSYEVFRTRANERNELRGSFRV